MWIIASMQIEILPKRNEGNWSILCIIIYEDNEMLFFEHLKKFKRQRTKRRFDLFYWNSWWSSNYSKDYMKMMESSNLPLFFSI